MSAASSVGFDYQRHSSDGRQPLGSGSYRRINVNPDMPPDLGKRDTPPVGVSQVFDFPEQSNTLTSVEAKYVRKLTDTMSCGIMYTFEDWDLDDFQLQQLDAYGASFLTVDEATRYMFLDAWYGSFDAHVGQLFVKMSF